MHIHSKLKIEETVKYALGSILDIQIFTRIFSKLILSVYYTFIIKHFISRKLSICNTALIYSTTIKNSNICKYHRIFKWFYLTEFTISYKRCFCFLRTNIGDVVMTHFSSFLSSEESISVIVRMKISFNIWIKDSTFVSVAF